MRRRVAAALLGLSCAGAARAHSFGQTYTLPIPFWLYLYGAAAALLLSFLVIAYVVGAQNAARNDRSRVLLELRPGRLFPERITLWLLRTLGLGSLALCIAAGLIGTQLAYFNLNMTLFWVVFALGGAYLAALVGDWYAAANPWALLCRWTGAGRLPYPPRLAWYPALLLYLVFIWLELYARITPAGLSWALLAYTALNLLGAWLWGREAWLRHGEFFSVFFGLLARGAPLEIDAGKLKLRQPFIGLLREAAPHPSLLLFVLAMLASTAYDGLHESAFWVNGFWLHLYHALTPLLGDNIVQTWPVFQKLYLAYQTMGLLLAPLVYLLLYLACIEGARRLARSELGLRELALRFTYTLLPIALVYNLAHYLTLFLVQGAQLLRLASDPLGRNWNLFGTAQWLQQPLLPDMGTVWHTQVALILGGHILSVYLAHLEALRLFPQRGRGVLSQVPMLVLMLCYTTAGLWVLSQPITAPPPQG